METLVVVPPSPFLARAGTVPRAVRRARGRSARRSRARSVVAAGVALAIAGAAYGVSLAWILWFVRESGAEWMQHLVGRIG